MICEEKNSIIGSIYYLLIPFPNSGHLSRESLQQKPVLETLNKALQHGMNTLLLSCTKQHRENRRGNQIGEEDNRG